MSKSKYRKLQDGFEFQISKNNCVIRNKDTQYRKILTKNELGFHLYRDNYIITPKMVMDYIRDGSLKDVSNYFPTCSCKGVEKHLGYIPYESEINGKAIYRVWCEECFHQNAMDI
jgi:hypothetical protein